MGNSGSSDINMKAWGPTIALVCIAGCCSFPVLSCLGMPEPEATVKQFAIGSKIRDLDRQMGDWHPSESDGSFEPRDKNERKRMIKTRVGEFPEDFEGVISLYHHSWVIPDDIKPSFRIELAYEDGKLVSVDYGIMPG